MGNNQSCDVVIIGAGFAGITASRELSRRGYDVVVLEGRDRIGGRTWYKDDALPGHSLELGGTWVHWFQPHAFAEISRYNLELVETIGVSAPEIAATVTAGRRKSVPYEEAASAIESLMEMVVQDAREVLERPFEPFYRKDALEVIDKLSIQDRIDGLDLTPEEKDLANGLWTAMGSAPCGDVGLVAALRWYALSGFDINAVFDTVGRYKLENGTRSLIQAIADDSSADIRLSTPVAAVEQSDEGVVVTTRQGDTLRAKYVVVAAPLNTFGAIDFSPALSAAKQAGISEGQPGRGSKAWVHVRGDLPKPFFAVAPESHLINYVVTDKVLDDGQLLIAFGPEGADLNACDVDQVSAELHKLFGDLEVVATTGHDWASDEFSRGTWCMFRPGQTTRLLAELQKPEGRVFFAGSDLANGWNGFIDGAIESGIRADREVHARISGNPS